LIKEKQEKEYNLKRPFGENKDVSECFGNEKLFELIKNYSKSQNLTQPLKLGVIGYPNVGKHCVIQSLIPKRSCPSAILNNLKHVKIDKQFWLIDSPARLFSAKEDDENLVLRNCLKAENPTQSLPLVQQIVTKCPQELLCQAFKKYQHLNQMIVKNF